MRKAKRFYYRKIQLIAWYSTRLYSYPFSWQHKEGKK